MTSQARKRTVTGASISRALLAFAMCVPMAEGRVRSDQPRGQNASHDGATPGVGLDGSPEPVEIVIVDDERPGKHKGLGLTLGVVAGVILGAYYGYAAVEDTGRGDGTFVGILTAFSVGGGLAGYALGGGFSHGHVDAALDHGREAVRVAERDQAEATAALARLRLSSLPGLELDASATAEQAPAPVLTASVR